MVANVNSLELCHFKMPFHSYVRFAEAIHIKSHHAGVSMLSRTALQISAVVVTWFQCVCHGLILTKEHAIYQYHSESTLSQIWASFHGFEPISQLLTLRNSQDLLSYFYFVKMEFYVQSFNHLYIFAKWGWHVLPISTWILKLNSVYPFRNGQIVLFISHSSCADPTRYSQWCFKAFQTHGQRL